MSDPYVRTIGSVEDIDGGRVIVGVDYDSVTICGYRLNREQAEAFGRLLVSACWEAGEESADT